MNEYRTFCVIADIMSLAGSKVSARSVSPGGSVVALSDRLSLASGSLPAAHDNPLTPQQLGVMGEFGFCIQKKKNRNYLSNAIGYFHFSLYRNGST